MDRVGPEAPSGEITHVSDTALWVAMYRAMESDRPDALFRDRYARRLAGPRGAAIVKTMPQGVTQAWAMIVRTQVFDEILLRLVAEGKIDEVLNLAAGLDVRPFRLELPPELRWTDVDFPDVIDYRAKGLTGEKPSCRYEAVGIDLADRGVRRALFDRIDARSNRVLVVSEGLLIYLDATEVSSLATDLAARSHFSYWIADLASPLLLTYMNRTWGKRLTEKTVRFKFGLEDRAAFFRPLGWREIEYRSNWQEARRLDRRMRLSWLWDIVAMLQPPARRAQFQSMAGTLLMERL
jgi:methyltransferase (TIGR00027 family)